MQRRRRRLRDRLSVFARRAIQAISDAQDRLISREIAWALGRRLSLLGWSAVSDSWIPGKR